MGTYFSLSLLLRVQLFRAPAVCGVCYEIWPWALCCHIHTSQPASRAQQTWILGTPRTCSLGWFPLCLGHGHVLTATPLPSRILFQARGSLRLFRPTHLTPTGATGALLCPFRGGGCLLTTPSTRWQPSTVHPPRIASDHCFPRCPPLLLSASGHVVSHEGRLPTKLSPGPRWAPNEGGGSQPPGA